MSVSQTSDEVMRCRLNKMTEWAKERREFLDKRSEDWDIDWHVRIGGNGFRAVSLNDERPLLGFGSGPSDNLKTVIRHFERNKVKNLGRSTPEKRAQAWLIKQAINHNLNLKTPLGLDGSIYEALFFALDEVSFGHKQLDILAVGVCGGRANPVLVELKSGRHLTGKNDLLPQLEKYANELKKYEPECKNLLQACIGRDIDFSKIGKIMVWPKSTSGKPSDSVEKGCAEYKVTLIESDTDSWSNNKDFIFHPFNEVYPPTPYIGEE